MSFEIKKIYTDNPYVDEIVYYSKQLAFGTVLKLKDLADKNETMDSLKAGQLYISCIENTATLNLFDNISIDDVRNALGFTSASHSDEYIIENYINNLYNESWPGLDQLHSIDYIDIDDRNKLLSYMKIKCINNYEETNNYYRMLHGLPAIGHEDYLEEVLPKDIILSSIDKPIHEMSNNDIVLLEKLGVIDRMIEEDPEKRQYMRYLGKKSIPYYTARRANPFDILYVPEIDSEDIKRMYIERLDANKFYTIRTVYSEAFKYDSDYYDNFIAIFIVLITMIDLISRVQEFITRKEIFDIRSIEYIFRSYGVPFFAEIPLKYQTAMVKNLHKLLKYKSTSKCMVDICSLFGFGNIKVFKYYLLKERSINYGANEYIHYDIFDNITIEDVRKSLEISEKDPIKTDEYIKTNYIDRIKNGDDIDIEEFDKISEYMENKNKDIKNDEEYDLKFLKVPLEENLNDYIRNKLYYTDYDDITLQDPKWDGEESDNESSHELHYKIKRELLAQQFNFMRTKYISIDTICDVAKMSAQQSYFFNFLLDNVDLESQVKVQIPYISTNSSFKISDVFTLLTTLTYQYNGVKDIITTSDHESNLYVNGFNFKADLGILAANIASKRYVHIPDSSLSNPSSLIDTDISYCYHDQYDDTSPKLGKIVAIRKHKLDNFLYLYIANNDESLNVNEIDKNDESFIAIINKDEPIKYDVVRLSTEVYIHTSKHSDSEHPVLNHKATVHAKEVLDKFIIPYETIPSFKELMNIYINNMDVRDELIAGMKNADSKEVYDVYRNLYDSLMTVQLTYDYYKNKDTGDFYKDSNDDITYTEYLKNVDTALYTVLLNVESYTDDDSRNQYIGNLLDSIIYALEEYIDTDEFQALFSSIPIMNSEAVKRYIATVINFYKSYKVDFLGINTIYTFDDDTSDGIVKFIDKLKLNLYTERSDFLRLQEQKVQTIVNLNPKNKVELLEKIYFDIYTWIYKNFNEGSEDDGDIINDNICSITVKLIMQSFVDINDNIFDNLISTKYYDRIPLISSIIFQSIYNSKDNLGVSDRLWIFKTVELDEYINTKMTKSTSNEDINDTVIIASQDGDASESGIKISELATEGNIVNYISKNALQREDIITSDKVDNITNEEDLENSVLSEAALLKLLEVKTSEDVDS